jgi:hypothetical protein
VDGAAVEAKGEGLEEGDEVAHELVVVAVEAVLDEGVDARLKDVI